MTAKGAGAEASLSVYFTYSGCESLECPIELELLRLAPTEAVVIACDTLEPFAGVSASERDETWPGLSNVFGARWSDYEQNLGVVSAAVSHRGGESASVKQNFQFAFDEAASRRDNGADTDSSDLVDLTDAIHLLTFLFIGGVTIEAPHPECGTASSPLSCESFTGCP